jgi:tRNA threonylcarbamoyl adenosine modification protein YjeE
MTACKAVRPTSNCTDAATDERPSYPVSARSGSDGSLGTDHCAPSGSGRCHSAVRRDWGWQVVFRAGCHSRAAGTTDVPSPTFTLVQNYDDGGVPIWHGDLYRISGQDEVVELGLFDVIDTAICLIEWPEHAGPVWPATALHLTLATMHDGRTLHATGNMRLMAGLRTDG